MVAAGGPSRRGFLVGAVTAGLSALLAGCGDQRAAAGHPTIAMRPVHGAAARADRAILLSALEMTRRTVAAYAAAIPLLPGAEAHWAQALVVEDVEHTGALAKLIALSAGTAPAAGRLPGIGHPRDRDEAIALLAALESDQVRFYLARIGELSAGAVRAGVASILASDAQHLTALRRAGGRPALGPAFALDGPLTGVAPSGPRTAHGDAAALRPLLAAQRLALACVERALAARAFAAAPASARSLVVAIRDQVAAHVSATAEALRRRGGGAVAAPVGDAAIDSELARHLVPGRPGSLRGPRDALGLLVDVERVAIGAAYVSLGTISDGGLATLVARMMASDAEHEALLFQAIHPGDVAGAMPFGVVEGVT